MCEALPSKKCFKCGEVKILSDFYKHPMMADGHVNKCKECNKKDVHKNRADNIDYVREYDRARRKKENVTAERWEELSAKRKAYSEAYYTENPEKWEERLAKNRKSFFRPDEWEDLAEAKREASREYYLENPDKWEERLAKSRKENCGQEEWERRLAASRERAAKNPDGKRASTVKYRESNPKKYKAHSQVGMAIKKGTLTPQPCEVCGSTNVHAHHADYDKPLDVMWLCPEHHAAWHLQFGEGLNGK